MKNLIYKNELFYLSDEVGKKNATTKSVSGYNLNTISENNMPHKYFDNKIVIYGRSTCPYCLGILEYLKKTPTLYKKVIFVEINTEPMKYFDKLNLLNILKKDKSFNKNHSTVPMVFNKGLFIGGSDDSKAFFSNSNNNNNN